MEIAKKMPKGVSDTMPGVFLGYKLPPVVFGKVNLV